MPHALSVVRCHHFPRRPHSHTHHAASDESDEWLYLARLVFCCTELEYSAASNPTSDADPVGRNSKYRLGDFFWGNLPWRERYDLLCSYRDSLAHEYYQTHQRGTRRLGPLSAADSIAALATAAERVCPKCARLPAMEASVALHLRVGDVNCGTQIAERTRRPFPPYVYASTIPAGMRVYIFAAAHFSAASSRTSHSCENATREYVQQVLTVSNGTLAPASSVDCDLCSMVAAKHFIQGQGCFSAVRALPSRSVLGLSLSSTANGCDPCDAACATFVSHLFRLWLPCACTTGEASSACQGWRGSGVTNPS